MTTETEFLITEIDLVYRNKVKARDRLKVRSSKDAYEILMKSWNLNTIDIQEQFKVVLLDRGCNCLGVFHVASGGVSACLVDPKLIFSTALKSCASAIVLAHNHPSGNLNPSNEDEALTERLCNAARLLEISIVDHLIVTSEGYTSFADEGNASLSKKKSYSFTK